MPHNLRSPIRFRGVFSFAGTERELTNVTVLTSDWALASTYGSLDPTWDHSLTFNIYAVDNSGANPEPGAIIATRTATFSIPWRPEADPTCPGTAWKAGDGNCYNGLAFTVVFNFTGVVVPNDVIFGVGYNTQTYGAKPVGADGPYNSLNFGLSDTGPSIGTNPFQGTAYLNSPNAAAYTDGGAGGTGTFRRDTNWAPYSGAVRFDAVEQVPEPSTAVLFLAGFAGLVWTIRRRRIQ